MKLTKIAILTLSLSCLTAITIVRKEPVRKTNYIEPMQINIGVDSKEIEFKDDKMTKGKVINEKIAINPNFVFDDISMSLFATSEISVLKEPFLNSKPTKTLTKRDEIKVIGYNNFNNLYKINIDKKEYYIENKNLTDDINTIFDEIKEIKYAKENATCFSYPNNIRIESLSLNQEIEVIGENDLYYKTIKGYIKKEDLSDSKIEEGRKVSAKFTAYYPADNLMEGGFYDTRGNLLDPDKNTCAAPKEIPLGTKIKITGTGTSLDGQVFTVNDRGGSINIEGGVYHFDILMSSNSECNNWGVRKGQAIILD